jgi:hypothetical protein
MATQPGDEQILQRLDSSFTDLENQRSDNLKRTQLLQTNKDNLLKKEQARLQKKYGLDHPRVNKINARIDFNKAAMPELKAEIKRAEIKIPEFDSDTWMVHGRVLNEKGEGIKGLTLALYDEQRKVEKRFGYVCTDERGYYAIRYKVKEGEALIDEKTNYFLAISDSDGKICCKEEKPLNVIIGQTDYRLIILKDNRCVPPPGWEKGEDGNAGNGGETGEWSVTGTVTYDDQKPATGLDVNLFIKETDKRLASTNTGSTGSFKFIFTAEKFPDIFKNKPDTFLVITDPAGKKLHVSEEPLHVKVGGEEKLIIILKRENPRPLKGGLRT